MEPKFIEHECSPGLEDRNIQIGINNALVAINKNLNGLINLLSPTKLAPEPPPAPPELRKEPEARALKPKRGRPRKS